MAGNSKSGRPRSGAAEGRAWCRKVVNRPAVMKMLERAALEDPNVAIKLFEHGYGRAPQSLTIKPNKTEVVVSFAGGNGKAQRIEGVTLDAELVGAVNGH